MVENGTGQRCPSLKKNLTEVIKRNGAPPGGWAYSTDIESFARKSAGDFSWLKDTPEQPGGPRDFELPRLAAPSPPPFFSIMTPGGGRKPPPWWEKRLKDARA